MYPISGKNLNREDDESIYFFTPAYCSLDNFSAHAISLWGEDFATAEHAFQWKKFADSNKDIADTILVANSPHLVKEISNANKDKQPKDWHERKVHIMEEILRAKANQHADVRGALKRSDTKTIVENSPVDSFWGIGPKGNGQNIVGKIWMQIRDSM